MRKPLIPVVLLGLFAGPVSASAPVHVSLKATAVVSADAEGFFTLGSVAALSGGNAAERRKFGEVPVGRAPLPNEVRQITPGDVLLKLRQAGFHPEDDAILEGAKTVAITVAATTPFPAESRTPAQAAGPTASPIPSPILIHRGDTVTILVQDGDMTISAKGVARDPGGAGETIHVHRDGIMTDLSVIVVDAQTVQLEM